MMERQQRPEHRSRGAFSRLGLVICHVTEACNLSCRYCSASARTGPPELLAPEILRTAARLLLAASRRPRLTWVFFGGEPLLAPLSWYRMALNALREEAATSGRQVQTSLQTNGTLIDDEVAAFLATQGFRVSITIDGPPELHDRCRSGGEQTVAGVQRLQAVGLQPAALVVLGHHNIDHVDRVIDFLLELGIGHTKCNLFQAAGRSRGWPDLTAPQIAHARWRIIRRMLADPAFEDAHATTTMRLLCQPADQRPDNFRGCGAPHCGAGLAHVALAPDGQLFPCDRCHSEKLCALGPVAATEGASARRQRMIRNFHLANGLPRSCGDCPARGVCQASCTAYRGNRRQIEAVCQANLLLWPRLQEARAEIAAWVRQHEEARRRQHRVEAPAT